MTESLRQLAVLPRPRTHWQAMDAGMLLARAHYWKLLALWFLFSLPIATLVLTLVLLDVPLTLAVFIYWWFKPLYELPVLMYLSRAVFCEPTSIRQAMKESRGQLFRLFRSYLTLSRFSPSRSMTAPVVFLEQQSGKARRQRVGVLTRQITRAYTFMIAWLHVEAIGAYALIGFILLVVPHDYTMDEIIGRVLGKEESTLGWFEMISYWIGPWILAGMVAPMYVGGGFLLYINRRMRLEAWDIEHQFHGIQQKHQTKSTSNQLAAHWGIVSVSASLAMFMALSLPGPLAHADSAVEPPSVEQTRRATATIFDSADFGSTTTKSRLVFKESDSRDEPEKERPEFDNEFLQQLMEILFSVLSLAKYFVYLIVGAAVALIAWRILRVMPDSWQLGGFTNRRKPTLELLDVEHHPLTKSLPNDIVSSASDALNLGDERKALSYLYRGALRTVMRRHNLSIPKSATEKECKRWVERCRYNDQSKHFNHIVDSWSEVAYANHQIDKNSVDSLIKMWDEHFSNDAPVINTSPPANPRVMHPPGATT